jgi:hypothetical protein
MLQGPIVRDLRRKKAVALVNKDGRYVTLTSGASFRKQLRKSGKETWTRELLASGSTCLLALSTHNLSTFNSETYTYTRHQPWT